MPSPDKGLPDWSPLETRLINTVDVFVHKPSIMKKIESSLAALKESLVEELSRTDYPCPSGTDTVKGQIVRGENHKGFPFISLDMPQMFSKTRMFTYRTLFWWGHALVFSLILKSEDISRPLGRLMEFRDTPNWHDIFMATTPTPWEWDRTPNHFVSISQTTEQNLRKTVESIQYIKLCRFYPLDDASFAELNWVDTGLHTWKILSKINAG
ncbi:hypothetical protein UR09_02690 [Candidatus Nitromaritima sp. SCGC AAA799-A02]|nr:hypothetical protein UR09_02690 [Candidatus Nitromaritima sp. SCGC AAA799-A02]